MNIELSFDCSGSVGAEIAPLVRMLRAGHGAIGEWDAKLVERLFRTLGGGNVPRAERVIFNDRATIVFWDDGGKTVVKCRECGDGRCVYDRDFELVLGSDNTVLIEDMSQAEGAVENIARCTFCQTHYDAEKAVMAAMLKRLHPNYQDVLREALGESDG